MAEKRRYCATCGTVGVPKEVARGSFIVEAILWLGILVFGGFVLLASPRITIATNLAIWAIAALVGFGYSVWRLASKRPACAACEAPRPIPLTSPNARAALAAQPAGPVVDAELVDTGG